jgi:flagellar M-ring protein FliF
MDMDYLRRLILQTHNHLKGLTVSQRLAIGSCVALIAVSLVWLMQWAGRPELVPLLDGPVTAQELPAMEQKLAAMGVTYKLANNVLMVPAERRLQLLAALSDGEALPKDTSIGFTHIVQDASPWLGAEQQQFNRTVALGNELAKALRFMNGVQEARVFIDRTTRRTVGGPPLVPTASVFVKLAPGADLDARRTEAIAGFVCRAVSGLDITKVGVTDARTGRTRTVKPRNELMPFDDLEDRQLKEDYFAEKIQKLLSHIPGLLVAVHAELDPESRKTVKETWHKPVAISEKNETHLTTRGEPAGGAGVTPNTSKAVTPTAVADRTEKENSETTYQVPPDSRVESFEPWHGLKSLTASVNVPQSYLAAIFKRANPGKDPTDADIQSVADEQIRKIRELVLGSIGSKDENSVKVAWFPDEAVLNLAGGGEPAVAGNDIVELVRAYGGKAGLGALAVVSLFMMLMMVRRASEGPVLPGEEPPKPQIIRILGAKGRQRGAEGEEEPETLTVGSPPIGEAEAREQLLVGREIDESTLRVQQVVDQVADLIKSDPKSSATILQRWIDAEKQ